MAFVGAPLLPRAGANTLHRRTTCAPRRPHRASPTMLDTNTVLAVGASLLGVGGGIGLMAFTEQQGERGKVRPQVQVCVDCLGDGIVTCNVCEGTGKNPVSGDVCIYCDGKGTITCLNCGGTGIQPRYLDRYVRRAKPRKRRLLTNLLYTDCHPRTSWINRLDGRKSCPKAHHRTLNSIKSRHIFRLYHRPHAMLLYTPPSSG